MSSFDLFKAVTAIYSNAEGAVANEDLYSHIENLGFDIKKADKKPIAGDTHNLAKRKVRWIQQTLKEAGMLEKVEGERGVWKFLKKNKAGLHEMDAKFSVLGFSTNYGAAILGTCESFFSKFKMPIHLILTSPPYPLAIPRKYGNVDEKGYVDWLCRVIEPAINNLEPGGSICLNLGNDIFLKNSPARSMYVERLILALNDRFGLFKMDNIIWENTTKPPGPFQWASKRRFQLNATYENVIWMCNDPSKCFADNRRVLQPHTDQHKKFMEAGGSKSYRSNADGSYRVYEGAYGNQTEGRIPRNVLHMAHRCADQIAYKKYCKEHGLVPHGATMPLRLAEFLISFLTQTGQTVADPFGGSFTTAKAAELLKRLWYSTELMYEYVMGGSYRFREAEGYENYLERYEKAA